MRALEIIPEAFVFVSCAKCHKTISVPEWLSKYKTICSECGDRSNEETLRRCTENSKTVRTERWAKICPSEFQNTDPDKLPVRGILEDVLAWSYGKDGLILYGPTGTGKSRCAWLLLKREWLAGKAVRCLNYSSGLTYAAIYGESAKDIDRWVERHCEADLLLLDDIFKSKLTDSFEAALFTIIAQRYERGLPIILTCNDTGKSLITRMSQDRGDAILRRLKEMCRTIKADR